MPADRCNAAGAGKQKAICGQKLANGPVGQRARVGRAPCSVVRCAGRWQSGRVKKMTPEAGPAETVGATPADLTPEPFRDFRVQLREQRQEAGLSRAELARLSGVSESTIKNLEALRQPLTHKILSRLLAVIELGLEPPPQGVAGGAGPHLNCWLAPDFDPIKMQKELVHLVNGQGGYVEQSYMYLDPMSAACWLAIAEQESYAAGFLGVPLDRAAEAILRCTGRSAGLDLIGLGCGDGKLEVRLVQQLLDRREDPDLRLYLLDISSPMLAVAYRHAAEVVGVKRGVQVAAIQGNFHHLPRYTQLLHTAERAHRRRVVCMLGATFGNLENEVRFLRNSLHGLAAGDLLLFDVSLTFAPADQPEEIRRRDPWLVDRGRVPWEGRVVEFLTGPLRRYGHEVREVVLKADLGTGWCPVPGSYAIEVEACLAASADAVRHFTLFLIKRHDPTRLIQCMTELGWDPIDGWSYGADAHVPYPKLLYLFRKRGA